jgi:hypothetical protein
MTPTVVAAVIGAVAGVGSSLLTQILGRRTAAAETERITAETDKLRAETEEIRSRLEEAQSDLRSRIANAEARVDYDEARSRSLVVFDSTREGFSLHDLELELAVGALADLKLASQEFQDDTLVLVRRNAEGGALVWLTRYGYRGSPNVIPLGDQAGTRRTIRVQCQVRALGAQHTFAIVLKALDAAPREHLDERRHRLVTEAWVTVDAAFSVWVTSDFKIRLVDRHVSAAPSRLEVRGLVVTERDAPAGVAPK